ncbi:MAG TPA: MFS transporter, partial [Thermomicrobiales bacterium]|nr:MFS transporter [Thermomicrobiales bacterium]
LGGSPIDAGLTVAPFSIGWSIASVVSGQIITRAGYRISVVAGTFSAVAGCVSLLLVSPDTGRLPAAAGAGLVGIGMGLSATAMLISVQNSVGWGQPGVATALVQFSRTIGGAVGVAVLGTLLTAQLTSRLSGLDSSLQSANALLDEEVRAGLAPDVLRFLTTALSSSLHVVFMTMLGLAIAAAMIVVLFFPRGSVEELQAAEGGMGAARSRPEDAGEPSVHPGGRTRPASR